MCTLTWWRDGSGSGTYEVFFNRDEKKTRSVAEPPKIISDYGLEFVAPIDPDGGGTHVDPPPPRAQIDGHGHEGELFWGIRRHFVGPVSPGPSRRARTRRGP